MLKSHKAKYIELTIKESNDLTTIDLTDMTQSQENAIENAIISIMESENRYLPENSKRVLREIELHQSEYGTIGVWMKIDNDKPGTIGYVHYKTKHIFIGRKGGYRCYKTSDGKHTTINGRKALIYC